MHFDYLVVRVALKLAEINVFEVTSKLDTFAPLMSRMHGK